MSPLVLGFFTGLTLALSIGPGFLALFQTSLSRGIIAGVVMAVGLLFSDISLILVGYLSVGSLFTSFHFSVMGLITGLFLIGYGGFTFFKKAPNIGSNYSVIEPSWGYPALFLKGYLLNIFNPFSLVFWIGVIGMVSKKWGGEYQSSLKFFIGVISTAFSADIFKCIFSFYIKRYLIPETVIRINRFVGLILFVIGIIVIIKAY